MRKLDSDAVVCAATFAVGGTCPVIARVSIVFIPLESIPDCTEMGSPGWLRQSAMLKSPDWNCAIDVTR
eukprot:4658527-Prymnesium_polylepis.1